MVFGTCFECNIEMNSETKRGVLYLKCPICGRRMKADDWWPEYYAMDAEQSERLPIDEAALIWKSHGKDEDYMFGYTEEELESV
ncbi:MAG: hypothetical protein IJC44_07330 [Clostridia bacterium]|nr:hypothetical protein [Clostridia bacterium]MBQ3092321.1 hypothetical protein [Clostridia bacterium]